VLVGANFADSVMYPPAEIVCGTVKPLKLNPVACTDSAEMATGAPPVFFTVNVIVLLEPTVTDPKLPGDGLNDSVPCDSSPCACVARGEKIAAMNIRQINAE
jgi:hypothetical protein